MKGCGGCLLQALGAILAGLGIVAVWALLPFSVPL
jgi:hypothetical protein